MIVLSCILKTWEWNPKWKKKISKYGYSTSRYFLVQQKMVKVVLSMARIHTPLREQVKCQEQGKDLYFRMRDTCNSVNPCWSKWLLNYLIQLRYMGILCLSVNFIGKVSSKTQTQVGWGCGYLSFISGNIWNFLLCPESHIL